MTEAQAAVRLDKWLFYARFFRTRGLASKVVTEGGVRLNGTRVSKPAALVRAGDVLTVAQGRAVRVVAVLATGTRRGPAAEAQALYEDRSPPVAPRLPDAPRYDKGGRPTKKDRRDMTAGRLREE